MFKFKLNTANFINYLAISTIFSEALTINLPGWYAFKIYNVVLFFIGLFLIVKLKKVYFNQFFIYLFILIIYNSLFNIFMGANTFVLLVKQIIGIFLHYIVYSLLIKYNNENVKKIFTIYLNFAFAIALIGLFQEMAYLINRHFANSANEFLMMFYDFKWFLPNQTAIFSYSGLRINSIMPEPFAFCLVMMPAFFVALTSFTNKSNQFISKSKSIVIITSFILTFSFVGYIGALCATILFLISKLKKFRFTISLILLVLLPLIAYNNIEDIKYRIDQNFKFFTKEIPLERTNLSTYTFFRNLLVTKEVLKKDLIFGNGLGSHLISYENYSKQLNIKNHINYIIKLNNKDANSLLLRLLSETGVFGFLIFLVFIYKFLIRKKEYATDYLWIINNSIFVLFIIRLIREGNYFSEGFFFFIWLYYYSKKISVRNLKNSHNMLAN